MVRLITGDPIGISGVKYLCVAIRSLVQLGGVKLPAEFPAARNSKSMVHAGTDRWRQASAGKMAAPC